MIVTPSATPYENKLSANQH